MSQVPLRGGGGRPPPRHPGRRRLARGVLAAVPLACIGLAAMGQRSAPPRRSAPFRAEHPALIVGEPDAVLYVSTSCAWCDVELRAWDAALDGASLRGPLVVLSTGSPADSGLLPGSLRQRVVHDHDGSVARALGVAGVPFLAELDGVGGVISVSTGVTGAPRRARVLARLNPRPPAEAVLR